MGKGGGKGKNCPRGQVLLDEARYGGCPERAMLGLPDQAVPGMSQAAAELYQALSAGEKIAIFSDYDMDGVSCGVLLRRALLTAGASQEQVLSGYADPLGGYGEMGDFVRQAAASGVTQLVISDCGSGHPDLVAQAQQQGMRVTVIDHHDPAADHPADHHLNPLAHGYENHHSAAQLCWKFGQALEQASGQSDPHWHSDALYLAAQAAQSDMMKMDHDQNQGFLRVPLLENGRQAVPLAFEIMAEKMGEDGLKPERLVKTRAAFNQAKRTNRVSPALMAAALLEPDSERCRELVNQIHVEHARTAELRNEMVQLAFEDWDRRQADTGRRPYVTVAVLDSHRDEVGQAGIVAMRLASSTDQDAVVAVRNGDVYKFSHRPRKPRKNDPQGYPSANMGLLQQDPEMQRLCANLGGHAKANILSGSCSPENLEAVLARIQAHAQQQIDSLAA